MTATPQSVQIPHLGGSTIGCRMARPLDRRLPTLILINSFTTSADLYRPQFADSALTEAVNLLALEPYGHGGSHTSAPQFTYWDSAIANLQVMDALDLGEAYALGTSQGGWIAARMAMLAPNRLRGIVPLGTSMDFESERSRELGCWDAPGFLDASIEALAAPVAADWKPATESIDALLAVGLGPDVDATERAFWHRSLQQHYVGDAGRERMRICSINLRDRDGLLARLDSIRCPVLWMHGTEDPVYSVANAEEAMPRFTGSARARLQVVKGGQHFLSASDPAAVDAAVLDFIRR